MNAARNFSNGSKYLLRREDYKRVKKMDRQEFESFCRNLYENAFHDGRESVPGVEISQIKAAIAETKGIGETRLKAIMDNIDRKFGEGKEPEKHGKPEDC